MVLYFVKIKRDGHYTKVYTTSKIKQENRIRAGYWYDHPILGSGSCYVTDYFKHVDKFDK